jgi:hypothetical protein
LGSPFRKVVEGKSVLVAVNELLLTPPVIGLSDLSDPFIVKHNEIN